MEFACNDISSLAAGFYNPKRAVAVISGKKGQTLLYKLYCICLTVGCGMW